MREALAQLWDAFEDVQAEILSIDVVGLDRVVVEANVVGHGRESGIPITLRGSHVFTLRHGKIARFEWFTSVSQARAALTSEQPRRDE
jgi:ketosteroid isomerase-like protein